MAEVQTTTGAVPVVKTNLEIRDRLGAVMVRLGFHRQTYRVTPGLYAAGSPDQSSPVLASANYKLSFDALRKELGGINAWILVVNTFGINVWCAAGKGSFSAEEVANRIEEVSLGKVVVHRNIILPQLSAPGVAAHKVREFTGFTVKYGPVRAHDIRAYLNAGMRADGEMRRVYFPFVERLKLTPLEFRLVMQKFALPILVVLGILVMTTKGVAGWQMIGRFVVPVLGAFVLGTVFVPVLLPWIPFRSFVLKGTLVGIIWAVLVSLLYDGGRLWALGNVFLLPAVTALCSLSFTGATTYTSPSGVNKEIQLYARPAGIAVLCGLMLTVVSLFLK